MRETHSLPELLNMLAMKLRNYLLTPTYSEIAFLHTMKKYSGNQNLDRNYIFLTDLAPNLIPFGVNSVGKGAIERHRHIAP